MKNRMLSKVFKWFGIGLLLTFITALIVSTNMTMLYLIFAKNLYYRVVRKLNYAI